MAFIPLESLSQLYDGYQRPYKVEGKSLLLCQLDGKTFLIENRCPHMDAPLTDAAQGASCTIRCRAHGIEFSLLNGKANGPLGDTIDRLVFYPIAYDGNKLGVESESLV